MNLSDLTVDAEAIEAGEWIDNLPECGDFEVLTRGFGCKAWRTAWRKKVAALPLAQRTEMPFEVEDRLTLECLVEALLIDWKNLADKGRLIPVSEAATLLADPRYTPLRMACVAAANRVGRRKVEADEDAEKN